MNNVAAKGFNKLRWRCRRGMRELDAILARYIDSLEGGLTAIEENTLSRLLDSEDDELWDWLSGKQLCPHSELTQIIDVIRSAN